MVLKTEWTSTAISYCSSITKVRPVLRLAFDDGDSRGVDKPKKRSYRVNGSQFRLSAYRKAACHSL